VACGVFLILISILGIFGAMRHHQVLLFFYMVILFFVFLIQFSVACACLAVSKESQIEVAKQGWQNLPNTSQRDIQVGMECCGFTDFNSTHPPCNMIVSISFTLHLNILKKSQLASNLDLLVM
jgi:tetraspanin-13/31